MQRPIKVWTMYYMHNQSYLNSKSCLKKTKNMVIYVITIIRRTLMYESTIYYFSQTERSSKTFENVVCKKICGPLIFYDLLYNSVAYAGF